MRCRLYQFLASRFPALAWTLVIFILLSLPGNLLPNENHLAIPNLDKIVHIIMFGSFVFLWSFYYAAKKEGKNSGRIYFNIFIIACLYGISMEFVQKYFIPNRDFDLYDIIADIIGAFAGYLFVRMIIPRILNS